MDKIIEKRKLRVWWIPQVPMNPFYVDVKTLEEADLLLTTLAEYDKFQYENRVKPDYSNAGGLQVWDDNLEEDEDGEKWTDWCDEDSGMEFDEYREEVLSKSL